MKNFLTIVVSVLLVSSLLFANKQDQTEQQKQYRPGIVIVKLKPQNSQLQKIDAASTLNQLQSNYRIAAPEQLFPTTLTKKKMIGVEELERIFTFQVYGATDVEALSKKIAQDPSVEYAQPDYLMYADFVPNDPLYAQVYPLGIVKAEQAWDIQKGDSTVVIAVIDTGVDWDHPDLAAAIWNNKNEIPNNGIDDDANGFIDDIRGWDFVNIGPGAAAGEDSITEDNNPMDFNGHGTHVAGIAAGVTNNGVGISSLGGGCKIMPIRIGWHTASGQGTGYTSSMAKGFVYSANNGASVANLSFGSDAVAAEGARYAFKNGVVVCHSAGNSNTDVAGAVGALPEALSIAATNSVDGKASYSTFNKSVDISAPGGDFSSGNLKGFLSTVVTPSSLYTSAYVEFQGTSMAAPFVAALAGLIKSKNKSWTPAQIMFQITGTADNIEGNLIAGHKGKMGAGRINALRALSETPSAALPKLVFIDYKINDAVGGNGNGILEPGENAKIIVTVRNEWGDAQNLSATLSATHWTTNVTKANSNFGLFYGISKIDSSQRGNLNDEFTIAISADAIPQVIPFTVTFNAAGGYTQQFSFNITLGSRLLLVDDDDGSVNVENYYTSVLNTLGTVYDIWDRSKQGAPPFSVLQNYQAVIWSCEWAFPSLDAADRTSISTYLNSGGKLFLSGQDVAWDLGDPTGPEFVASSGASKTFLETYLKAKYVDDDALHGTLQGVASDTIGNGLTIVRNQPGRASTNQYPDVIDTTGGSVYSFKYSGGSFVGRGGAILFSKNYKLAFFGFGGFESITDSTKRVEVMERMLKWMFEYSLVVDKLPSTENTTTPYPIGAVVSTKSAVQNVSLYWDTDGTFPFNKITMTAAAGKYSASIPAQTSGKNVEYFVLVKSATGFLPYLFSKFYVGPDVVPPVISVQTQDTLKNSIKFKGPFVLRAQITDNLGLDTTNILLRYSVNSGSELTVLMKRAATPNIYEGSIVFGNALLPGDSISYYITAKDVASISNTSRYPAVGFKFFFVGKELVDNFEVVTTSLWNFGNWGYSIRYRASGSLQNITDSPTGNYPPNTNNILRLLQTYNLSEQTKAELQFHQKTFVHSSDTVFLEISRNGNDWIPVKKMNGMGSIFGFPVKEFVNLNNFVGVGNETIHMRFRLQSDGVNEADGIFIDDIEIVTGNYVTTSVAYQDNTIPYVFSLQQNYPNPFNPTTTIQYTVPIAAKVILKVYDVIGKEITTLVNSEHQPGFYHVKFDASKLSSGIYYYRISSGSFTDIKKMLVIK